MKKNTMKNNSLIKTAQDAFEAWDTLGINGRVDCLKQVLTSISEEQSQMALWQLKNAQSLLSETNLMSGPTGEHNELSTQGRGVFLCVPFIESEKAATGLVGQIFTALVAGNTVITAGQIGQAIMDKITPFIATGVIQHAAKNELDSIIDADHLAGIATLCDAEQEKQLNQRLSEKTGLIGQLITETDSKDFSAIAKPHYILRFITERTVSINTTAIGGNATLLELGSMEG